MLQIKNISKKYVTGGFEQIALNDVSLSLRDNEFVAILGPSGSGKTTLLNIIGGLDRYDSGDLIIDGVSTKKYRDRDWDSYRNHTVGFVFQSYNLIPHQTVLGNVELALTIGGISSSRRREMALNALDKVGLKDQAHKRPNQMSGGQMQRVAIARALVNDPKILLADEPTGALDTKTSLQVMELLKEVASDRLVVMVTHNPELAEQYANRTVRLKDGVIISDTNPLVVENEEPAVHRNLGKASMSIPTAFGLSLNNLMTKMGRTVLTSFAGSIGIIGIALILALSTGFQNYIDQIQEETMNSYPLTISSESGDLATMILSMNSSSDDKPSGDKLVEKQYISDAMNSFTENDLKTFRTYLEKHPEEYQDYVQMIKYNYAVTPQIYTIDAADNLAKINPNDDMNRSAGQMTFLSNFGGSSMSTFSEMTNPERISQDFELLAGRWPEKYNELVIALSNPNEISDLLLYSLGLRDTTELGDLIKHIYLGEKSTLDNEPMTITYSDLLNLDLRLIDPSKLYKYNEEYDIYEDMTDDDDFMMEVYEDSEPLKVVGIIWPGDSNNSSSSVGVLYLPELTRYVMDKAGETEIVRKQLADPDRDVFSGDLFDEDDDDDELDFQDMITVDEDLLKEAFQFNGDFGDMSIDESKMQEIIMASSKAVVESIDELTASMVEAVTKADSAFADAMIKGYRDIATIKVENSTAPETNPDVSEVTKILEEQRDTAYEKAKEASRPAVTQAVQAMLAGVKQQLEAASSVEEAEAVIDELAKNANLDEDAAAQLKALIIPGGSYSGRTDPAGGADRYFAGGSETALSALIPGKGTAVMELTAYTDLDGGSDAGSGSEGGTEGGSEGGS
ncbi:MAG: ATP-binding cassette domain-containing protein, partial [Eubacteriales bacterium]|nr:ATP-binding cassette domain-containing protein [Eubacteriales bacterium]